MSPGVPKLYNYVPWLHVNHVPLQTVAENLALFGETFKQTVGWTRYQIGLDPRGLGSDSGSEAEEGIFG